MSNQNREYLLLFNAQTGIAISNQKKEPENNILQFHDDNMEIFIKDFIFRDIDSVINFGLEFVVKTSAENPDSAILLSKRYVELLLNVLCFSTLCYADGAKILTWIERGQEKECPSKFYIYPNLNERYLAKLCIIELDLFKEIFDKVLKSSHQNRVIRAITWLRNGLNVEKFDEFISNWIALEILSPTLKDLYIGQIEKGYIWGGVKKVFSENQILDENQFEEIKDEYRQGIFHGFKELNAEFVKEVDEFNPKLRKGVIACICKILDISKENATKLITKKVRKENQLPYHVYIGNVTNLLENDKDLIKNFPRYIPTLKANCEISENNTVSSTIQLSATLSGPMGVVFNTTSMELWGNNKSGFGKVSAIEINVTHKE